VTKKDSAPIIEDLHSLPNDWKWVQMIDIGAPEKNAIVDGPFGSNLKVSDYVEEGPVRVLTTKNLYGDYEKVRWITWEKFEELKRSEVKSNDILMAKIGSCGKTGIYPPNMPPAIIPANLMKITVHPEVNRKYVYYYYDSLQFQQHLRMITKATAMPAFGVTNFKRLPFPFAPQEQQKRIVAKIEELFSHIDAGIAALNKSKQLLKQYRQSVLKSAVTGELTKQWREENKDKLEPASELLKRVLKERDEECARKVAVWEAVLAEWKASGEQGKKPAKPQKYKSLENNFTGLAKLPAGWCWTKLGNLAVDVFDGPFGSNLKSSDYVGEGVRVIRLENIGSLEFKDEKVTYVTEEKYLLLKKHTVSSGDIIFSSFVADGTRVVVLPANVTKAINKADCFCVRAFGASSNEHYLANFLSTHSTYKRLENQVHGATRPRINTTQLKDLEVPICSAEEQLEIVRLIKDKFESISRLENYINLQLAKSERNKQSILASAFTGVL